MLRTFQRDTPAFASRPSPVSRPPGAPRRFASFFPRTDTAKSASATLITNHSVSIDSVKDLQNLAKTVRQTLPGNMGAVIQQALDAAAHEHSGSPSVIADEPQTAPGSDAQIGRASCSERGCQSV